MVEEATGIDFARAVLRQAVGKSPRSLLDGRASHRTAANWIVPLGGHGLFAGLDGLDHVERHPDTRRVLPMLPTGSLIPAFPRFEGFPAFVLSSHENYDACVDYQSWVGDVLRSKWRAVA
jgi:hypothetical protein